jgi:hypothetical protein
MAGQREGWARFARIQSQHLESLDSLVPIHPFFHNRKPISKKDYPEHSADLSVSERKR